MRILLHCGTQMLRGFLELAPAKIRITETETQQGIVRTGSEHIFKSLDRVHGLSSLPH